MKRAVLLVLVAGCAAVAAERLRSTVIGGPLGRFTVAGARKISVQCPGLMVYHRIFPAQGDGQSIHDAGVGDAILDFVSNPDPYRIDLGFDDRYVYFRTLDAGTTTCYVYLRDP